MEGKSWNNIDISLPKASLSKEKLEVNLDVQEVRNVTDNNALRARELLSAFPDLDRDIVSFFEKNTLVDGSVDVSNVKLSSRFFREKGVCAKKGRITTTRGYDYICSLDASLTSLQKIKKYQETIQEVIRALKEKGLNKLEKLLLLDYLKNALISIFNSFIYQEKLGTENTDPSSKYQIMRHELMTEIETIINHSISLILNKDQDETYSIDFGHMSSVIYNVVGKLTEYHLQHKLPGSYVSRPEATHPLTIIGSSLLYAERYKKVATLIGVPSGGTELAFTTKIFMNKLGNNDVNLILLPVSLHSSKQLPDGNNNGDQGRQDINNLLRDKVGPSVLICDDNTSTGRTLQLIKDSVVSVSPNTEVFCAVAEADVTRSRIDKDRQTRTHIANRGIYADSVDVLPVSKSLAPKVDLREMIEKKKIVSYYRRMERDSFNLIDQISASVMAEVNRLGVDYSSLTEDNAVLSFEDTFLSNFHSAPVELNNMTYPTVEHAYQASKFFNIEWSIIPEEAKEEIRETLKMRGYTNPVVYGNALFTDKKMTPGNVKIIADILRKHGFVDKNWENKRVKIMVDLLLQKFSRKEMFAQLKATKDKVLAEGNTWGDTLWGISNGKGRNMLGVALMEIRKLGKRRGKKKSLMV